jgi:ubiquinone/menaquinone biosynthesis C-methylase UbiE
MKRSELYHPRIFDETLWAESYYKRNAGNIRRTGKRFASLLSKNGFSTGKILDVGCGFAAVPIEMARLFPHIEITGIDLGVPLLELGRNLIQKAGYSDRIRLHEGDAENIDFKDNTFDVVVNTYMLHIVEDPVSMLNEIERVAKPAARIMMTDLRRGFMALFLRKFRTTYTMEEALQIIRSSQLRKGILSNGPFWWDYMAGFSKKKRDHSETYVP